VYFSFHLLKVKTWADNLLTVYLIPLRVAQADAFSVALKKKKTHTELVCVGIMNLLWTRFEILAIFVSG
jgi:hypothetical protein